MPSSWREAFLDAVSLQVKELFYFTLMSDLESFSGKASLQSMRISLLSELMKDYRRWYNLTRSLKIQWNCGVLLLADSNGKLTNLQCPLPLIHYAPVGQQRVGCDSLQALRIVFWCGTRLLTSGLFFLGSIIAFLQSHNCAEDIKASAVQRCSNCPDIFSYLIIHSPAADDCCYGGIRGFGRRRNISTWAVW